MSWIKRNLFFVVGGVVALLSLGAGGFYTYQSSANNSTASEKLNEIYGTLKNLQMQSPAPGNEKINNTELAKAQQQKVQEWVSSAGKYFQPIASIPSANVTSEAFASALRRTVDSLQHEADSAGVSLPPKYDFSFSAQRPLVKFASGSLDLLATQLGEVRTISETIFSAKVNSLDSIQRVRVSEDDATGAQGDYLDRTPATNELAVITPYIVTFRCFTPELARVLGAFATSTNAFLIRAVNLQPAGMATAMTPMDAGGMPPGGTMNREFMPPPGYAQPGMSGAAQPTAGKGGLQTILKEQLLRVTMEVDLVKLLPKS